MYEYIKNPNLIEEKSFDIIGEILGDIKVTGLKADIIKRVIHTTADFEYGHLLEFKAGVEQLLLKAFKEGCTIVSDTNMIKSGISKKLANELGIKIECYVDSKEAYDVSKSEGITRSMAAVDIARKLNENIVFIIGNAPTALYRIMELYNNNRIKPIAVVGVPVGFVGAAESKEELWNTEIPSIITRGRKGGSTIGVAIVNAILREANKSLE